MSHIKIGGFQGADAGVMAEAPSSQTQGNSPSLGFLPFAETCDPVQTRDQPAVDDSLAPSNDELPSFQTQNSSSSTSPVSRLGITSEARNINGILNSLSGASQAIQENWRNIKLEPQTLKLVSRSEEMRTVFELPEDEVLMAEYNCALLKKILLQGKLYLFDSFLCFHSPLFASEKLAVPLSSITSVCRAKTAGVFNNALEVLYGGGTRLFLSSFISREDAYYSLVFAWSCKSGHAHMFLGEDAPNTDPTTSQYALEWHNKRKLLLTTDVSSSSSASSPIVGTKGGRSVSPSPTTSPALSPSPSKATTMTATAAAATAASTATPPPTTTYAAVASLAEAGGGRQDAELQDLEVEVEVEVEEEEEGEESGVDVKTSSRSSSRRRSNSMKRVSTELAAEQVAVVATPETGGKNHNASPTSAPTAPTAAAAASAAAASSAIVAQPVAGAALAQQAPDMATQPSTAQQTINGHGKGVLPLPAFASEKEQAGEQQLQSRRGTKGDVPLPPKAAAAAAGVVPVLPAPPVAKPGAKPATSVGLRARAGAEAEAGAGAGTAATPPVHWWQDMLAPVTSSVPGSSSSSISSGDGGGKLLLPPVPAAVLAEPASTKMTLLLEASLQCGCAQFLDLFWCDVPRGHHFWAAFYGTRGDTDVFCSPWQPLPQPKAVPGGGGGGGVGVQRVITFQHPLNLMSLIGPKATACTQTQTLHRYAGGTAGKPGTTRTMAVIHTEQSMADIPFADAFSVKTLWHVEDAVGGSGGVGCCRVCVYASVPFSKRVWLQGQIERGAMAETKAAHAAWMAQAEQMVAELSRDSAGMKEEAGDSQADTSAGMVLPILSRHASLSVGIPGSKESRTATVLKMKALMAEAKLEPHEVDQICSILNLHLTPAPATTRRYSSWLPACQWTTNHIVVLLLLLIVVLQVWLLAMTYSANERYSNPMQHMVPTDTCSSTSATQGQEPWPSLLAKEAAIWWKHRLRTLQENVEHEIARVQLHLDD